MMHPTIQGAAALVGIIYFCLSGFVLLISSGWAGQRADFSVPALIEALKDPDARVRGGAAWALRSLGQALQDARATEMIGPLKATQDTLIAHPDPNVREQAATVKRAVDFLELLWWRNLQSRLLQGVRDHPALGAGLAAYLALLFCWLTFHGLRPLWLYRINEALKPYTDFALPATSIDCAVPSPPSRIGSPHFSSVFRLVPHQK